jgi:hypothetical protein
MIVAPVDPLAAAAAEVPVVALLGAIAGTAEERKSYQTLS